MRLWVREWLSRRTTVLMVICAVFLLGLVISRFGLRVPLWFVVVLFSWGLLVRNRNSMRLVLFVVAALLLGVWRGGGYYDQLAPYRQSAYQKVTIEATALEDAVYVANGQLGFSVSKVKFIYPDYGDRAGQIKIKGYGELAIYRGDVVRITGKMYPIRGSSQASIGYAEIKRVGGTQTIVDEFRRRFGAGLMTALPEPEASFGLGLLIGQRSTLPDDVAQSLKMVGLTHIIAVSGYNLTILITAVRRMMGNRSKFVSTAVAVGLMLFFVSITGASPSIVRAAVVSGLSLAAWYFGREVRPMVLILLSAALTAGFNPVYIWSDIGWYLSFLAFFGILMLSPQVIKRVWPKKVPNILGQIALETLAAEIMTIPLVLFIFGQVSLVGLVANMLVASLIPLAMVLCFVAGIVAMILPLLVGWVAWPATLLLTYMIDTAGMLSKIPHGFVENRYLSWLDMVLCYAALLIASAALYKPKRLRWTDRINARITEAEHN